MTLTITNNSQAIIRTSATASLTLELKHVSNSTSIGMKIHSVPKAFTKTVKAGSTKQTPSVFARRVGKWKDQDYRQGYLEGCIEQGVAWQIRANRKARGLTQSDFAKLLDTNQSAVSRLEDETYGCHSLDTLVKVAHAFDCALSVKFIPYSQLAEESLDLREATMVASPFVDELKQLGESDA